MSHEQRLRLAHQLADALRDHYGEQMRALGIYGSLARGTDGPYSDIEMFCVVTGARRWRALEWSQGAWKAEIDVCSLDVLLQEAATLEGSWPITHGAFVHVLPIADPEGLFPLVRDAALSHTDEEFRAAATEVIVGEIYELIGKARNAVARLNQAPMAAYAVMLARHCACLLGLWHRHLYTSIADLWTESLELPQRPDGYDALCRQVMSGDLNEMQALADAIDRLWDGIERWAQARQLPIERDLAQLLAEAEPG